MFKTDRHENEEGKHTKTGEGVVREARAVWGPCHREHTEGGEGVVRCGEGSARFVVSMLNSKRRDASEKKRETYAISGARACAAGWLVLLPDET